MRDGVKDGGREHERQREGQKDVTISLLLN